MDVKKFDRARRSVGPVQLDLVESYAQGKISRRAFLRRGTVIGLSVPLMAAVIAACGDDDGGSSSTTPGTTGAPGTSGAPGVTSAPATSGVPAGGTITVGLARPATLDPVSMQDAGAYSLVAQSFEYLVGLGDDLQIGPGLAESWSPNADLTEWTFNLRTASWHDGSPFTSADVAATMDRLATAGNPGLTGVIEAGSVDATDPKVAKFKLAVPSSGFPYLVSLYNAQSAITPAGYAVGTTLDKQPSGTGPWKLTKFDAATGATFVRNDAWWGGPVALETAEYSFFEDVGTMVTAMAGGSIDALSQFQVIGGDALLNDADFNVLEIPSSAHRQVWMRCDIGTFAKKEVRQALALTFDRDAMVQTLFKGRGVVANDHLIAPFMPFFDPSVPQRTKNIDQAKALLAQAGLTGPVQAVLYIGDNQEIPDLAQIIQSGAAEAGFDLSINKVNNNDFYGQAWCPASPADPPCSGAAGLGIVDYGHRPTPDVTINAALKSGGTYNSSQYNSPDFDAAFAEYQAAADVAAQQAACKKLETILNDDVPVGVPYFYNFLSGHSKKFTGVRTTALAQVFLDKAAPA